MVKTILLIGASEKGVIAAKKLGFKIVIIITKDMLVPREVSKRIDAVYMVNNLEDYNELFMKLNEIQKLYNINLVLSFTEVGLRPAALISEKLKLPSNSVEVIDATRNKATMRKKFSRNESLKLEFRSGKINEFNSGKLPLDTPFVVKPLDGFGSKGVCFVKDLMEWENWYKENSDKNEHVEWIIEPFIAGDEYSVELVSFNGKHKIIGITEKKTTGKPNFIEIGHTVPPLISEELHNRIIKITNEALDVVGIQFGPSHVEVKCYNDTDVFIIEMHTRPGGDQIPFLHELSTGEDQYELGIHSYYDYDSPQLNLPICNKVSTIKFLSFKKGLLLEKGFKNKLSDKNIIEWDMYREIGDEIDEVVDSFGRFGHIIACSKTREQVDKSIDNFERMLSINIIESK